MNVSMTTAMPVPAAPPGPYIGIVTAAYKAAKYFDEAVRSVQAQTHALWRWVIVDDGSTDRTFALADWYGVRDNRIQVLQQDNAGVSGARNRGVGALPRECEFVLFFDADDVLEPDALQRLVALAEQFPGAPAVNGWSRMIDADGVPVPPASDFDYLQNIREAAARGYCTAHDLLPTSFILNPAQVLCRRAALADVSDERAQPFDPNLRMAEDWDLWQRLAARGAIINTGQSAPVMNYRRHPGCTTNDAALCEIGIAEVRARHAADAPRRTIVDPLQRVEITIPDAPPLQAPFCIATVASPGFDGWLDSFLGSLHHNGQPDADTLIAVMLLDNDATCRAVMRRHIERGLPVQGIACRSLAPRRAWSKSALYSIAHVVEAGHYACIDADTLILGDLQPLRAHLQATPDYLISVALDCNGWYDKLLRAEFGLAPTVYDFFRTIYGGTAREWCDLQEPGAYDDFTGLTCPKELGGSRFIVNDGVFGGARRAMLQLDEVLRPFGVRGRDWLTPGVPFRNQFLFNLAILHHNFGAQLPDEFNVQLHANPAAVQVVGDNALWRGRGVRILHFTADTKTMFADLRARYATGERV